MKWNKWLDKWTALPRGQRRATIILLIVSCVLCIVQLITSHHSSTTTTPSGDYTQLEEEIALFRSQLDTIPEAERRPIYIRRTHAHKDSAFTNIQPKKKNHKKSKSQTKREPTFLEPVPRINDELK